MTILNDFRLMSAILEAKPQQRIDIVLSTHCPTETEEGIICKHNGKNYLIAHFTMVRKIEYYSCNQGHPPSAFGNSAFGGAVVIENEPLVATILLHHDGQSESPFALTESAKEWAMEQIAHCDVTFAQNEKHKAEERNC